MHYTIVLVVRDLVSCQVLGLFTVIKEAPNLFLGMSVLDSSSRFLFLCTIRSEEDGGQLMSGLGMARLPAGALAGHSVAAVQAAHAAMAAQVAALEQLRDKLETGEPPEKKMALPAEEHHRLLQRALQHNLMAMTAQLPMNIRINNQGTEHTEVDIASVYYIIYLRFFTVKKGC